MAKVLQHKSKKHLKIKNTNQYQKHISKLLKHKSKTKVVCVLDFEMCFFNLEMCFVNFEMCFANFEMCLLKVTLTVRTP